MTKLKRIYAATDDIPETFRPLFIEQDGKHILDAEIEGLVTVKKVDEFRDTNTRLMAEKEALELKFKDIDVERYRELEGRAKDLEDGKLLKRGTAELEAVLQPRVSEAIKPFQESEKKLKGDLAVTRDKLEKAVIENQVVQAALPLGLRKGAAPDLIERARKIFKLNEDGEVVAYNADGKTIRYHLGTEPYTLDIFAKELANDENGKHLFEDNRGGGGEPRQSSGGGGGGDENPFDRKAGTWNQTKQGLMIVKDFKKAQRLAAKVGITLKPLVGA